MCGRFLFNSKVLEWNHQLEGFVCEWFGNRRICWWHSKSLWLDLYQLNRYLLAEITSQWDKDIAARATKERAQCNVSLSAWYSFQLIQHRLSQEYSWHPGMQSMNECLKPMFCFVIYPFRNEFFRVFCLFSCKATLFETFPCASSMEKAPYAWKRITMHKERVKARIFECISICESLKNHNFVLVVKISSPENLA